jgi:hypothetical protein
MVWFTEYDTCQHTTVYTANINNSVHCKYKQQCTLHMYVSCIIAGLDLHYLHVWNIWYVLPIILVKLFLVSS